jgi:hypothetical protein
MVTSGARDPLPEFESTLTLPLMQGVDSTLTGGTALNGGRSWLTSAAQRKRTSLGFRVMVID